MGRIRAHGSHQAHRRWVLVAVVGTGLLLAPATARAEFPISDGAQLVEEVTPAGTLDAIGHLATVAELSPSPDFRRYGTQGLAATAKHLRQSLRAAGYEVLQFESPLPRWEIHYGPNHLPLLQITDDPSATFAVESGMARGYSAARPIDISTGPEGRTCRVVLYADLTVENAPTSCALVPFGDASPEWNNVTAPDTDFIGTAASMGAQGVIFQGDPDRDMVFIQQVRHSIPVISAAVTTDQIVGREVVLRVNGRWDTEAMVRNVIGVIREPKPGAGYVALTAHIDSWFQGAVDNGAGTAAVMDAAESLAAHAAAGDLDVGVIVIFADAEEVGIVGSERVASELTGQADRVPGPGLLIGATTVRMSDIIANVNLDAPSAKPSDIHGHDQSNPLAQHGVPIFSWRAMVFSDPYPASDSPDPYIGAVGAGSDFLSTFAAHGVFGLPAPSSAWTQVAGGWRTDAQHFDAAGIPVIWPVAGYPEYHTNLDVYDPTGQRYSTVDPVDLQHVADATVDWVLAARPRG